jgi:surface-anchored protein
MKLHNAVPLFAALLFSVFSVQAQIFYTTGHGDIGVGYDPSEQAFEPHWHLGEDDEYAPSEVVAVIQSTGSSPAGLSTALGVPDGTSIWVAGSSARQPNLGFATEELDSGDWDGEITLSLTGWTGPGEFALYTTNLSGTSVVDVYFSTDNPASTFGSNSFGLLPGDHQHFTFGFTTPGRYEFEFTWTGTHVTDGVITTSGSFAFDVVPEPATAGLLLIGTIVVAATRHRRA